MLSSARNASYTLRGHDQCAREAILVRMTIHHAHLVANIRSEG